MSDERKSNAVVDAQPSVAELTRLIVRSTSLNRLALVWTTGPTVLTSDPGNAWAWELLREWRAEATTTTDERHGSEEK